MLELNKGADLEPSQTKVFSLSTVCDTKIDAVKTG